MENEYEKTIYNPRDDTFIYGRVIVSLRWSSFNKKCGEKYIINYLN